MTDERRWTVLVCGECEELVLDDCGCEYDPLTKEPAASEVVVVPVSSVVPISRLREWIAEFNLAVETDFWFGYAAALDELSDLLDDVECASNPNNERTNG